MAVFTVEYLLRVWSATADPRYAHPVTGRLRFMLTPGALVDLVAIVPAYLPTALDLRFARIVRLGRMMRILKIGRYSRPIRTFGRVFHARRDDLALVGALLLVLLVLSSSAMYFLENRAQPEAFSSIPASMWWAVSTLTTVGYGDIYPVTPLGKVVGSFLALFGIGFFALPAGILAGAFARELRQQKTEDATACPHCGKAIAGAPHSVAGRTFVVTFTSQATASRLSGADPAAVKPIVAPGFSSPVSVPLKPLMNMRLRLVFGLEMSFPLRLTDTLSIFPASAASNHFSRNEP